MVRWPLKTLSVIYRYHQALRQQEQTPYPRREASPSSTANAPLRLKTPYSTDIKIPRYDYDDPLWQPRLEPVFARYLKFWNNCNSRLHTIRDETKEGTGRLPVCGLHHSILLPCVLEVHESTYPQLHRPIQHPLTTTKHTTELGYLMVNPVTTGYEETVSDNKDLILSVPKPLLGMSEYSKPKQISPKCPHMWNVHHCTNLIPSALLSCTHYEESGELYRLKF